MPPKAAAKKHSKTPSNSKHSESASKPSSPWTPTQTPESNLSQEHLSASLEEASKTYPSLIGASAFVGHLTITDVISSMSGASKIWLSQSSMVASSFSPGSTVSVSLALSEKGSSSFPLSSLADGCARSFGLESQPNISNEAGNFFALATVFPSHEIVKNEVRLSTNLSYTMGCPGPGSTVFVYPIQSHPEIVHINDTSKELYLELVLPNNKLPVNLNLLSPIKSSSKSTSGLVENGSILSPVTPSLFRSKLSSPSSSQLSSPTHTESPSVLSNLNKVPFNSADVTDILGNKDGNKLLETCAVFWLNSRKLLSGNFVIIPILSNLCTYRVIGANKLPADSNTNTKTSIDSCGILPEICMSINCVDAIGFLVNHETKICLSSPQNSASESLGKREPGCKDVKANVGHDALKLGGLSKEYAVLKDIISSSVKDTLSRLGLRTTKGVLLHGPPGTGKTSLAHWCARDAGINLFSINGPEIVSQYYGESEKALHDVFDSASQAAPAVVFIDELDSIAPARKEGGEELSQRMVATLLNLMDGISRTDGLLVVAATNRPDSIEPALRRPGRLDHEIEIGVPSSTQRLDILRSLLSDMDHCLLDHQVQQLAIAAHGFVGADLAALCNEAALFCLRRHVKFKESRVDLHSESASIMSDGCSVARVGDSDCSKDPQDLVSTNHSVYSYSSSVEAAGPESTGYAQNGVLDSDEQNHLLGEMDILKVAFEDFEKAKRKVRPSAMREVILEVPKIKWEEVGGQKEVKAQLMEAVEWPQKHQDAFKRIGTRPPTGVLMFGPPGCSKTLMARAVASETGLNFLAVKGPELFSKWVGESEKAVRSLFAKARANAPSIIFFDEIDGLAAIRGKESDGISVSDRVMSQLLVELDGLHQRVDVSVIAATNRPDRIDPALLRPGRFDRLLYVGPPNDTDRADIFRIHLSKIPCSLDVNLRELANLTEGCTGADISLICHDAAVAALEENLDASQVSMEHLKHAIRQVQPTEVDTYQELSAKFQRHVHSDSAREGSGYQPYPDQSNWNSFWGYRAWIEWMKQFIPQFMAAHFWKWRKTYAK